MKIVVAIDSFKACMTSLEAGNAVKAGIMRASSKADVLVYPIADGGEGTVEALTHALNGQIQSVLVTNPIGKRINANYGIINNGLTAVIEISAAAGITLLSKTELNPYKTTTFGVGELIREAIIRGCRNFIIGLGGSATNDGGAGMLQALGFKLLDIKGNDIPFGSEGLASLHKIKTDFALSELKNCKFRVACDVTNPLCGEIGCSRVFAPQKGADETQISKMDTWLFNFAKLTKKVCPNANIDFEGAGAAGGLGFAFHAYTNAVLEPGINIIIQETKLEEQIKNADFVITGEGRLDSQTVMGKAPIGIAKIAKKYHKPVLALSGSISNNASICNENGIDAYFSILRNVSTLNEAMNKENALENLVCVSEQAMRLILATKCSE